MPEVAEDRGAVRSISGTGGSRRRRSRRRKKSQSKVQRPAEEVEKAKVPKGETE